MNINWIARIKFLSTPSARRATRGVELHDFGEKISIHALREEGDYYEVLCKLTDYIFLSTPSARRATRKSKHITTNMQISIHALREEGDW